MLEQILINSKEIFIIYKHFFEQLKQHHKLPDDILEINERLLARGVYISNIEEMTENYLPKIAACITHIQSLLHNLCVSFGETIINSSPSYSLLREKLDETLALLTQLATTRVPAKLKHSNASVIQRADKPDREKSCKREQDYYHDNLQFQYLLSQIWHYALENAIPSKSIFISYAWPNIDEKDEAWTKDFVDKLALHLTKAGMRVYTDVRHSGPGVLLAAFMQMIQKVDHVFVISTRTMAAKLEKPESGVSYENAQINARVSADPSLKQRLFVIPVLCNYSKYVDKEFSDIAEASLCESGYFNLLISLLKKTYGLGQTFENWLYQTLHEKKMLRLHGLPMLPAISIKRTALLDKLEQLFEEQADSSATKKVLCHGIPGSGKTTVVRMFCDRMLMKRYQQIIWLNARDIMSLEQQYFDLIDRLPTNTIKGEFTLAKILDYFATQKNCLIVADNLKDFFAIDNYLPKTNVDVILISCMAQPGYTSTLTIDTLTSEEAKHMFDASVSDVIKLSNENVISQFIQLSHNLPTLLSHFCHYMMLNKMTLQRFLLIYEIYSSHILSQSLSLAMAEKDNLMYKVKSFLQFADSDRVVELLIHGLSWLNIESIPKALVENIGAMDKEQYEQAFIMLKKRGLLQKDHANSNYKIPVGIYSIIWSSLTMTKKIDSLQKLLQAIQNNKLDDIHLVSNLMKKISMFIQSSSNSFNEQLTQETLKSLLSRITSFINYLEQHGSFRAYLKQNNYFSSLLTIEKPEPELVRFKNEIQIKNVNSSITTTNNITTSPSLFGFQPGNNDVGLRQPKQPALFNVPTANPNFIGRNPTLAQLKEKLQATILSEYKPVVITACKGLGGVGKTQIAIEYAYRNVNNYKRIIWIPAHNEQTILDSYRRLGLQLDLISTDAKESEIIAAITQWLESHTGNLLIFDNAQDNKTIERFLPSVGNAILITSRHDDWPGACIDVNVFNPEEALAYIDKILEDRDYDTPTSKKELAEIVGYLPLALAQAVAYIYENDLTIEEYLARYQRQKQLLLMRSELPLPHQHEAVFFTWEISRQSVLERSPLAIHLLDSCAFLHHQAIPGFLLEALAKHKEMNHHNEIVEEAIGVLSRYSLMQIDQRNYSMNIHEVLHEVLNLNLANNAEKKIILANLISVIENTILVGNVNDPYQILFSVLQVHYEAILNYFHKSISSLSETELRCGYLLANNLSAICSYNQSRLQQLLIISKEFDRQLDVVNQKSASNPLEKFIASNEERYRLCRRNITESALEINQGRFENAKVVLENELPYIETLYKIPVPKIPIYFEISKLLSSAYINMGKSYLGIAQMHIARNLMGEQEGIISTMLLKAHAFFKKGIAIMTDQEHYFNLDEKMQAKNGLLACYVLQITQDCLSDKDDMLNDIDLLKSYFLQHINEEELQDKPYVPQIYYNLFNYEWYYGDKRQARVFKQLAKEIGMKYMQKHGSNFQIQKMLSGMDLIEKIIPSTHISTSNITPKTNFFDVTQKQQNDDKKADKILKPAIDESRSNSSIEDIMDEAFDEYYQMNMNP